MNILEKTLNEMPEVFTSNQFNDKAIENGYSKEALRKKGLCEFLRHYADNGYLRSKTWKKKSNLFYPPLNHNLPPINKPTEDISIEKMINILKSKGYKVMKPVSDWVEC